MAYYNAVLDMARRLGAARLDESETAVLTFILLVNSGKRRFQKSVTK